MDNPILTHAETSHVFKAAPPDTEPLVGPTRIALEIEDIGEAYRFTERDPKTLSTLSVETMRKDNH